MKASKREIVFLVAGVLAALSGALSGQLAAQTAATEPSAVSINLSPERWSILVSKIDSGEVNMAASFQIAIYENLVDEMNKTKRFEQVFRDGDHRAARVPNLLTLKTKVEKYTPGSEIERAVTTVGGATKLTVRTELCTADGAVVLERTVNGNVRFMGSNLRATHNLAHNVAKLIQQSSLPEPSHLANSDPEPWGVNDLRYLETGHAGWKNYTVHRPLSESEHPDQCTQATTQDLINLSKPTAKELSAPRD
jgi:hypothetical protein